MKKEIKLDFKEGDILIGNYDRNLVLIFKEYTDNGSRFSAYYNTIDDYNTIFDPDSFSLATEADKMFLFRKITRKGLMWNNKKKAFEELPTCIRIKYKSLNDENLHNHLFLTRYKEYLASLSVSNGETE